MGLIWTSNDSEFQPRRSGYTWEAICDVLRQELGPEYAQLLAEPVPRRGEGKTDWYAEANTPVRSAADLDPSARAELLERFAGMRRQVLALADRLEAPERRVPDKGLAEELRAAICVPDENRHVCSVGGSPLLVAWGRRSYTSDTEAASIVRSVTHRSATEETAVPAEPETPPVTTPPPPQRRFPWAVPFWVLFVGLVGASYYLLLQACGIVYAPENTWLARFLPNACRAYARAAPNPVQDQRAELLVRIRQAELDVARNEGDCAEPVQLPRPPLPHPPPGPPDCPPVDPRLAERGATVGTMEITLEWNGYEDLDLHVMCPGGEISFERRIGCSGGRLDVDMNNGNSSQTSNQPVEHVVWVDKPPLGAYDVNVVLYARRSQAPRSVPFNVYITRNGQREGPFRGVATTEGPVVPVRSFRIEAPLAPPRPECVVR